MEGRYQQEWMRDPNRIPRTVGERVRAVKDLKNCQTELLEAVAKQL